MGKHNGYRNRRKFEIEEARNADGTYQAIKLFAKNTKILVIQMPTALLDGFMWLEYERDGQPSGIADTRVEFFAINFDLRNRIYFMRSELLRKKARRYFRVNLTKVEDNVKYVQVPTDEMIRFV
ncbi:hypothetical protein UFOVP753_32 [uncultured Caudovirales phage]|jgi:hypothetical protein|uniref:Uncharacterized protein n=1 Tax=uncultured Caudovirales phage TaxID=2100421 RepID=A0A6J7X8T3_9CAUD|nr:hypothetical protein UFOVP753_32 [uncultured Caudovirales phage]